jgi:raffinose/stachyose/melibiose transport system substrate-binding protein
LIRQLYLSKDGTRVGSGHIYGVPDFAEILGVFYNKSILAKLGLKQPRTFAEFEASLQKAKSAKVTPLMIGGLDKWPWVHAYGLLADHFASPSALISWYNAHPNASIVSPGTLKAASVLQLWVKNGYFEDGANGVSDGDAVARFGKGLSLYKIDGPWETEVNSKALGKNVGFFLLPAAKAGVTPPSTGSMGWDVAITAKSKNADTAATFLNFLTTKTARAIIMKHQNPPGAPGRAIGLGSNPVLRTIVDSYARVLGNGNLVPDLDTGYPQVEPHDILANVQSMAAGKMSPADFLKSTQAGWAAFHKSK